ncbi:MAG: hypothetical protein MUC63_05180, partial [Planctomycetes bacterium]|nr:hypothetical protein [Planctomycetota bacterium]
MNATRSLLRPDPRGRRGGRTASPALRAPSAAALALWAALAGCAAVAPEDRETPWTARSLLAAGLRASERGDLEGAEEAIRAAIAEAPSLVEAHRALQDVLEHEFRGAEAFETYRSLAASRGRDPDSLYLLGRLTRDPEEQAALFREALDADPSGYWPNLSMGYALLLDRSYGEAERHFRKALEARPGSPGAWAFVAQARASDLELEEAIEAWGEAARLDPRDPAPALQTARLLLALGRRELAFEAALPLLDDPEAPAERVRAVLRKALLDDPGGPRTLRALEAELRSLGSAPGDPARMAFAGYLALKRGRAGLAVEFLRAAEAPGAGSAASRDLRQALFATGRAADGFRVWQRRSPPALWEVAGN